MIYINPNWSYREAVGHIRTLKDEYQRGISSFSMFQTRELDKFVRTVRSKFYAMKINEKQIEKLWEYMNEDIPFYVLLLSSSRRK